MKQFFTLIGLLASLGMTAQITIVSDDITPLDVVATQAEDGAPDASIVPGGMGEQNWDFSALQMGTTLEFTFVEPSTTPYFDQFSDANLASEQNGNYFYFIQTDAVLSAIGTFGEFDYQGQAVTAEAHIEPPQTLLNFPANVGDSFMETIVQSAQAPGSVIGLPADSARVERTIERSVTLDAYGMVTTPLGTFEAIRSTEMENISDQLYILTNGIWSPFMGPENSTVTNYNWWTKDGNFGFPVVQIQTDDGGAVTGANWITDFVSGAEEAFDLEFALYPNPAPNSAFVEFPEFFEGTLEVVNLNGQVVFQKEVSNMREQVSTQNFAPGTYVVVVKNTDGRMKAAKRFEVVR